MADIVQLTQWCKDARALLSRIESEGPAAMTKNFEGVNALLLKMRKLDPPVPELRGFEADYERLATQAHQAQLDVKNKQIKEAAGKAIVKQASKDLHDLKLKMELVAASVDPTATPEVRKRVLEAARNEPVYRNKRERIQEAIDELMVLPGTKKQVLALIGLLNAGKALEPDFAAGYKALEGLSGNLKSGLEAAQKFEKGAGDDKLQKVLVDLRKAISDYDGVAGIGDSARVGEEREAILATLRKIDQASESRKEVLIGQARVDLAGRTTALNLRRTESLGLQQKVEAHQKKLSPLMTTFKEVATRTVLGPMLQRFNAAQALAGSQQYGAAKEAFDALAPDLERLHGEHDGARQQWLLLDAKFKDGLVILAKARNDKYGATALVAARLDARIQKDLRLDMIGAHDFAGAVKTVNDEQMLKDIEAIAKVVNDIDAGKKATPPSFEGAAAKLVMGLDSQGAALKQANAQLKGALKTLGDAQGHTAALSKSAEALMDEWTQATAPFTHESVPLADRLRDLGKLTAVAERLATAMNRLVEQARTSASDPEQLKLSKAAKLNAALAPGFETTRAKTLKSLTYLDEYGAPPDDPVLRAPPSLASLWGDYKQLVSDAKGGTYATAKMDKLGFDAENKRGLMEQALRSRREATTATATELTRQIDVLRKAKPAYAAYYDSLVDRLSECVGGAKSTVLQLMAAGEASLAEFKREVESQAAASGDESKVNFSMVDKLRAELKTLLEAKDLKEYQPATQARLLTDLTKVFPTKLVGMSPTQAVGELNNQLMPQINELRTLTDAAKLRYENMLKEATRLKGLLETYNKEGAKNLYASLKARIEGVEGLPKSDASNGVQQLKTIAVLITNAADPAKLGKMDKKIERDALQAELDTAAFKAAVDVFKKDLQQEAKNVYDGFGLYSADRNSELYGLISKRLDDAEKEGKTNPRLGLEKLRVAEASARAFMANPHVPAVAARKALVAGSNTWKTAVSGFLKGVSDLKTSIKTACDTDGYAPEKTKKALDALDPLNTLFNAVTFEHAAELLSKAAKDESEVPARRAAKEHALLLVQRFERQIAEHRLLRAVADNPFSPVQVAPLTHALKGLNGAFLAS